MHQGPPWRRANQARLKELRVRLRRYHARTDTPAQTVVAPPITSHVLWSRIVSWITKANAKSPMLPIAVPAASTETSCLARPWPFSPARPFLAFSCLSINVALAGKMAGNARKRPPTAGPYLCPMMPANAVISPPSKNRTANSGERNRGRRSEQPCKTLWLEKISEQRKCGNRYSSNQEANENQFHNAGAKPPPVCQTLSPQVNFALPPPRDSSFPKARSNLDENCCEGVV